MKKQELLEEIETVVIKDMIIEVNKMLGQKPAAFLSSTIMRKLKPVLVLREVENLPISKKSGVPELDEIVKTSVSFDEPDVVLFELLFEDSKKSLKRLLRLVTANTNYFAFQYIKYTFATISQMTSQAYLRTVLTAAGDKQTPMELASTAIDMALTNKAAKLCEEAKYPLGKLKDILPDTNSTDPLEIVDQIKDDFDDLIRTKIPGYIRKLRLTPESDKDTRFYFTYVILFRYDIVPPEHGSQIRCAVAPRVVWQSSTLKTPTATASKTPPPTR